MGPIKLAVAFVKSILRGTKTKNCQGERARDSVLTVASGHCVRTHEVYIFQEERRYLTFPDGIGRNMFSHYFFQP